MPSGEKNGPVATFTIALEALYKPSNTLVAIKCIPSGRVGRRSSGDCHEIRCLRRLRHPNIIRLYADCTAHCGPLNPFLRLEAIESPEELHMVMEYVSGGDLLEYVGKHQVEP